MQVKQFHKKTICVTVHSCSEVAQLYTVPVSRAQNSSIHLTPPCSHIALIMPVVTHFADRFVLFSRRIQHRLLYEADFERILQFCPILFSPGWVLGAKITKKASYLVYSKEKQSFTLVERVLASDKKPKKEQIWG